MGVYTSKYTGEQIDNLLGQVENGGGSTGGNFRYTKLNSARIKALGTYELTDSITNYDAIVVEANLQMNATGVATRQMNTFIIVDSIQYTENSTTVDSFCYQLSCDSGSSDSDKAWKSDMNFGFKNPTTLEVGQVNVGTAVSSARNWGISAIYGIKF